ncbi:MAG TPA: TonB-dependent receptor [Rhizomicrobium sp.]|jgi:outer membrane receptor protein involved in Fe transport|nr:TonB-dependent receptor [Rhizomicrobium sp.]
MVRPIAGFAAISTVLLALVTPSAAQQMEIVQVTAARLPSPVGNAAFDVTTIDATQLSKFDQIDTALEQVPGVSLFRRSTSLNSNATTEGISLRNIAPSGAGRALIMLDGVPVNDPFGGWVIWSALPYEDLRSVDIIKGAGAGPYGAGALTGTVLFSERDTTDGIATADISGGSLGTYRAGASGGAELGKLDLFASGWGERSNGWIPADPADRRAADNHLWFDAGEASLRGQMEVGDGAVASARVEYYDEARGAGLVGADSEATGTIASLTVARPSGNGSLGWRLQSWLIDSNLNNTSVSVAPDRSSTTPANDQYAIPALGYGFNAALLGNAGHFRWESGGDLRVDAGQSKELYGYSTVLDEFTMNRRSGGLETVGGLYGEGAYDTDDWLLTLGVRGDYWSTAQGHLVQSLRSTGAVTLDDDFAGKDGVLPTARGGARYNFDGGFFGGEYLRAAVYDGFRIPTLNELYRPFRVGNVTTSANAALKPEKLAGTEIGWGGDLGAVQWNTTLFWNRLHDAIANVTTAPNQLQRQNAGDVNALGFEGDVAWHLDDSFILHSAISMTDARVRSADHDPQIDGNRPAQAPTTTITGAATWIPVTPLHLDADLHWESTRFEDDQNTLRLGSAFVLDLRATWLFRDDFAAYAAVYNAANANVVTGETSTIGTPPNQKEVESLGQPRTFEIGLTYTP